ncbi:MAG: hypothetical protein V3V14_01305 [Saprospiraceae bacterium]
MFLRDTDQLTNNLWEALYYSHNFNPFMNLLAGIHYKLPNLGVSIFLPTIFYLFSLALLISLGSLLQIFNFKDKTIVYVVTFFSITPAFIFFENFFIYTLPSAAMLGLSAILFYFGLKNNKTKNWLLFFSVCALLSLTRASYHFIWLIFVFIGIIVIDFKQIKAKTLGFILPFLTIFCFYLKNYIILGFFGASSWIGFNLNYNTIAHLSVDEKNELINNKIISPLAQIPIFSDIVAYNSYINIHEKMGISVLDDFQKNGKDINYNHHKYIEISKIKLKDDLTFIKLYPIKYLKATLFSVIDYHGASTRWHPLDKDHSPHIPVRKKIGLWENIYNSIFHFKLFKNISLFIFTIPIFLYYLLIDSSKYIKSKSLPIENKVRAYITWNILFLLVVSCMLTASELERYRFITESFIWIIVLIFIRDLFIKFRPKKIMKTI